jgi:KaiC/GvpD/RAD55 family RecA-like ATPase
MPYFHEAFSKKYESTDFIVSEAGYKLEDPRGSVLIQESDVVEFLKDQGGKASLQEVANAFDIPRYGSNSAWVMLERLRKSGVVERRGEFWILTSKAPAKASKEERKAVEKPSPAPELTAKITPEMQAMMEMMAKTLAAAMKETQAPTDEWMLAEKPMTTEIKEDKAKMLSKYELRPDVKVEEAKKPLIGFPTGTFLDEMFLTLEGKPLGGIPICGQFAVTGLPGAGKSIIAEEIAVRAAANGRKVLFVTAEDTWKSPTSRFDLQSRLVQKAQILKLNWKNVAQNLYVLDAVATPDLLDWTTFAETYRYMVETRGIELVLIDSVTALETYRGALKYRVMELARYNQVHGVTALFINQRSSEEWDSYEMAGGIGLAHNLDGTIIVDFGRVYWFDQQIDLEAKRGEFVRIARILDCRLCNFVRRRIRIEITRDGFVRALEKPPFEERATEAAEEPKPGAKRKKVEETEEE